MRRTTLLNQVLLVNLLLIVAAVVAAILASSPNSELRDTGAGGLVLGFALAATVAVNFFLLARRFEPLEKLADEMEQVNLAEPRDPGDTVGGPIEVQRLEATFRRMLDRLEAERRHGASAALAAQERERTRVARDLHDEVNQSLTGLVLRIEALRTQAPPELSAEFEETRAVARQAMQELVTVARRLRPTALDDLGLKAALADLVEDIDRRTEIKALIETKEEAGRVSDLDSEIQLVTYRIAQEAISNAVNHSGAEHIRLRLELGAGGLELRVSDDGRGLPPRLDSNGGLGLAGMRERALLVGGALKIESRPGLGTRVRLSVPTADEGG